MTLVLASDYCQVMLCSICQVRSDMYVNKRRAAYFGCKWPVLHLML